MTIRISQTCFCVKEIVANFSEMFLAFQKASLSLKQESLTIILNIGVGVFPYQISLI